MEKVFLAKGVNDCKIVIPKNAHVVEKTAAEELAKYIEKSLGLKLPIICECEAEGKCIYVGMTEYAEAAGVVGKTVENWIIKMVGGNLVLTGGVKNEKRGVIYSVYHFLEDIVGVRWWNPYEEDVPSRDSLSLAEDLYREGTPAFHYRKPHMEPQEGADAFHFMAKTRTNVVSPLDDNIPDGVYDERVLNFGGAMQSGRPHHVHVLGKYFPADKYFDEHPEWWAWNAVNGKHMKTGSYCFSNEGFFNALLGRLLEIIKEDIELSEKTGAELPCFYSLSLDDINADLFCQCPECAKVREAAGDTGYTMKFVNRIAREVKKVYPFVKLEILIYSNFVNPPKDGTLPEPNVICRLANLFSDMLRGPHAKTNKYALELIERWADICKKSGSDFYIYDYIYTIRYSYPFPVFFRLKDMIQTYYENGVKGIFVETQNSFADCLELNKYVLVHLLEDPNADVAWLISDFTDRYYGKAGAFVREYFELLRLATERNCMGAYCVGEDSRFNFVDSTLAIEAEKVFNKARAAVRGEVVYERRVNWLAKALYGTVAYNFFELRRQAADRGENFDFDIKELKTRILSALSDYAKTDKGIAEYENTNRAEPFRVKLNIEQESRFFGNLPEEEELFDIPEALSGERKEDIFQFSLVNLPKYMHHYEVETNGQSEVEDTESSVKKVLKLSNDEAKGAHIAYMRVPTSKFAEKRNPIYFRLNQNGEVVGRCELYREDLVQDGYHLYKVGSFEGVGTSFDTRISLPAAGGAINLTGIAVTFPMDKCDVYVRMKVTGEVFGGKACDENAIYLERMIIVRR